jgi:pimeloyl-ACP methyl ester carboxylesterase
MKRLGYTKYVAQGGDAGALVSEMMAVQAPPELIGIHVNFPSTVPPDISKMVATGAPAPPGLSDEENRAYEKLKTFFAKSIAYALEMGLRPQTLYGIADSPVGLAAWMLDHDPVSLQLISRSFDGVPEGLSPDDILDNITHIWLTNTGVSSAKVVYWENITSSFIFSSLFDPKNVSIPIAVSVFPDELYQAPRTWTERAYPKLIYYNKVPKGGHFAAWEQPQLFSEEVRAGFRPLRK